MTADIAEKEEEAISTPMNKLSLLPKLRSRGVKASHSIQKN
jgi:hypothetical protein